MPDSRPWYDALAAFLEQGAALSTELEREDFAAAPALAPGGGVGAHLRHVADFVRAFLRDAEQGRVDYDRRERDARFEQDPRRASDELGRLARELRSLPCADPGRELVVRSEACLVPDNWQRSSVGRELATLVSHTVHHYALIAVLLRARGIEPPPEFGVAPSTLAHWQRERAACAPQAG
jgi:uncharacterized damage-inducible protein DinB